MEGGFKIRWDKRLRSGSFFFFFFNDPAPPETSPLSLPAALPIFTIPLKTKLLDRYPALDRELISGLLLLETPSIQDEGKEPTPGKNNSKAASAASGQKIPLKRS